MLAQIESITKYDDSKIVIGMIICCALMFVFGIIYDKYLRPKKLQLSGLQAIEITAEMIKKVGETTVNGSTIEKRASELQHDVKEALSSQNNASNIWGEILDQQKLITKIVEKAYIDAAEKEKENHKERIELQISLNKKILELATNNT